MSAHQRNVMYATDTVATCLHLAGMGGSPRITRRDLGFVRASGRGTQPLSAPQTRHVLIVVSVRVSSWIRGLTAGRGEAW